MDTVLDVVPCGVVAVAGVDVVGAVGAAVVVGTIAGETELMVGDTAVGAVVGGAELSGGATGGTTGGGPPCGEGGGVDEPDGGAAGPWGPRSNDDQFSPSTSAGVSGWPPERRST